MIWIFVVLFLVYVTLQIFDAFTTSLAYEVGLGAMELNPLAALLMSYNLLWLGKLIVIIMVGLLYYWFWKKNEIKLAMITISILNCFYVGIITVNLLALLTV